MNELTVKILEDGPRKFPHVELLAEINTDGYGRVVINSNVADSIGIVYKDKYYFNIPLHDLINEFLKGFSIKDGTDIMLKCKAYHGYGNWCPAMVHPNRRENGFCSDECEEAHIEKEYEFDNPKIRSVQADAEQE